MPGVAEVAPVGGYGKQYQINLDPNRLQAYGVSIGTVTEAVRRGSTESGGRLIEFGGTEYNIRGRGYARSVEDFADIVVSATPNGTPIRIKDLGDVSLGPDIRRGITEFDGQGEAVSGIVIMRQGQNALNVIKRVKAKLEQVAPGLPEGVKVVPVYDRSDLILRAIDNLKSTIFQVMLTVALIVLIFLWHIPSSIIPLVTIPVAVLLSFIPFRLLGITANIMSLGGIAIAIGALVDASIVVVEQTHKSLEQWDKDGRREDPRGVIVRAVKLVAAPSFYSLLVIAVAFLPVLALEDQEGRMFKPLAYTKNLSILIAAVLAITLDPALRLLLTHVKNFSFRPAWLCRTTNAVLVGTIRSEDKHPISRCPDAALRPGGPLVPGPAVARDGDRRAHRPSHRPGVPQAGLRVHAAPRRGVAALHADDHARLVDHRGPEGPPGDGPHHPAVPRGPERAGQGRARRDVDRPRAPVHARDRHHPQAEVGVAEGRHLVLGLGAGLGPLRLQAYHSRPHLPGRPHRPDEPGPEPARPGQRLDDADQGPDRHAERRGCARRSGSRSRAATSTRSRRSEPRSNRRSNRSKGRGASSPRGPAAAIFSISSGTGKPWPGSA